MPSVVSTGQITIIDQNDAKTITAFIGSSGATQQTYTLDNSISTYIPNWTTSPLTLTAYVYIGSTTNQADNLTNKKWSTSVGGTSLGSNSTYTVSSNIANPATTPSVVYYFEGDYTDPASGFVTKVLTSIELTVVKTGTNAVYVTVRGTNVILKGNGADRGVIAIGADLVRTSGYDTDNLKYRWYASGGSTLITQAAFPGTGNTGSYGLKSTTAGTNPTALVSDISAATLPADDGAANWNLASTNNTLVLNENAVTDIGIYKVEIRDTAENLVYSTFFTVFDTSDPYSIELVSSAGDKLKDGEGSTELYPRVFNGSTELGFVDNSTSGATADEKASIFQGWTFEYLLFDKNGKRAGFVDTTRTAIAVGVSITGNSAGSAGTFTVSLASGSSRTVSVGDVIKLVTSSGIAEFYEVSSNSSGTTVTLRYTNFSTANSWLSWTTAPTTNYFGTSVNPGKFFICQSNGKYTKSVATTGITTVAQAINARKITVTGYEIDGKGTIFCEASRP